MGFRADQWLPIVVTDLAISYPTHTETRGLTQMNTMMNAYVRMTSALAAVREEERGATAVEYGLIVALIAAIIIGIVTTLGAKVSDNFNKVSDNLPS